MQKILFIFVFVLTWNSLISQELRAEDKKIETLESLFFQNNYQLIASRYEISKADAEILEARLWQNPNLSINQINLWANSTSEKLPPIAGAYGKKQQISIDLEQVIETAGKRKNRIAYYNSEKEATLLEVEILVRELQLDLYKTYIDFCQYQHLDQIFQIILQDYH